MIEEVSAWVYAQCGELYFEEDMINSIQGVISSIDEKVEIRGAEARTYHIAKHLVRKHEVTVITSREEGTKRDDILGICLSITIKR